MTTNDPTQPMVPRLPESPDEKEPPTHTPEQPIDDPPPEGPPGARERVVAPGLR